MDNIVDFNDLKNKKQTALDLELEEWEEEWDKEDKKISYHDEPKVIKQKLDSLWNDIYIGKKVSHFFADDDGQIHYKSRWVSNIETDHDYEWSLKEHLRIIREFINNENLAYKFMKFCDEEVNKAGCLKLLVLSDPKEKSPS